jgi:RimJ/RimL family protein N-acetyltransferase
MAEFSIRPAREDDAPAMAELFAAVAAEGDGIATEAPVDLDERAAMFVRNADSGIVAEAGGRIVGMIHVEISRFGYGDLGMLVDRQWRGRGIGSRLLGSAIAWSRGQGLHKLSLDVFPANAAAIRLYRKCGFVEEGRRVRHYRRSSGELWDSIVMGLSLE